MDTARASAIPQRVLGRSGIQVSHLGLGGLFVSRHGAARDQGIAAVRRALDLGVNMEKSRCSKWKALPRQDMVALL